MTESKSKKVGTATSNWKSNLKKGIEKNRIRNGLSRSNSIRSENGSTQERDVMQSNMQPKSKKREFAEKNEFDKNRRNTSKGRAQNKPKEHNDYNDIRIRGGQYVMVDNSDYDDDRSDNADMAFDAPQKPSRRFESFRDSGLVIGRNAVRELLKSNRSIDKLYVKAGEREGSIIVLIAEAASRGIPIVEVEQHKLDAMSCGENHQGVIASAAEKEYTDVEGILKIAEERGEKALIVIADGIEDPHNLGAIIRSAECAGAHGVIIPKRRAVGITSAVSKASAGAIEHMAIAKVNNIVQTIEKLKERGVWIFAAEAGGPAYYELDFNVPAAIVLGSEGDGVGRLIKEKSDFIASIPMYGSVNSLNVSAAAAVMLCHAARMQRSGK